MNNLQKHDVWMRYHTIKSSNITATSWLSRNDPDAICRHDLHQQIVNALDGEFTDFQLNARTVTYRGGELNTSAWVLEMDCEDEKIWAPKLHRALPFQKTKTTVQLIPFSAAAYARETAIKKVFYLQNHFLNQQVVLRIDNLKGLDAPLTKLDGSPSLTLRQTLASLRTTNTSEKLFTSICQYNSGRVTLACKKSNSTIATQAIDHIIDTWIPSEITTTSRQQLTFPKPPVRIGHPTIAPDVLDFENAARSYKMEFDIDNISIISELNIPAIRTSYGGSQSYASVAGASISNSTQPSQLKKHPSVSSAANTTTTTAMDRLLASIQQRTDSLDASHTATKEKVTNIEQTLQATLVAVNNLASSVAKQALILDQIANQLEHLHRDARSSSPTTSPQRKKRATEASQVAAAAIENIKLLDQVTLPSTTEKHDSDDIDSFKSFNITDTDLYAENESPHPLPPNHHHPLHPPDCK